MPDFIRRRNRLPDYDYSAPGAYFITIRAKDGAHLFRSDALEPLTPVGNIVDHAISTIEDHYPGIKVDKYVIMPNHIHMILIPDGSNPSSVSTVIAQTKGIVTKAAGRSIWHKSFHDHIIRNEADYLRIREYIDNNPARWREDCYYAP